MAVNITDRSAVEALIRDQIVSTIFQDAPKQSAFMGMARKLPNMTSKQTRIRGIGTAVGAQYRRAETPRESRISGKAL